MNQVLQIEGSSPARGVGEPFGWCRFRKRGSPPFAPLAALESRSRRFLPTVARPELPGQFDRRTARPALTSVATLDVKAAGAPPKGSGS